MPPPLQNLDRFQCETFGSSRDTRTDAITLGIIGGGQLAKMTACAAASLGCKVVILERQPEFPAGSVAARTLIGDWNDPDSLLELAALADVVTLELAVITALGATADEALAIAQRAAACLRFE